MLLIRVKSTISLKSEGLCEAGLAECENKNKGHAYLKDVGLSVLMVLAHNSLAGSSDRVALLGKVTCYPTLFTFFLCKRQRRLVEITHLYCARSMSSYEMKLRMSAFNEIVSGKGHYSRKEEPRDVAYVLQTLTGLNMSDLM